MKSNVLFTLLTTLLLVYTGCESKKVPEPASTTPPVIRLLDHYPEFVSDTLCGALQERVMKLAPGDTVFLELHLTGENDLAQYKLEVHENFDCHGHEERPAQAPWDLRQVTDLSSKDTLIATYLPVPAEAARGNYHFNIHLLDREGNEAEHVEFSLVLE